MKAIPTCLLVLLCLSGCARRYQPNSNCEWPNESPVPLNVSNAGEQQRLSEDALAAEDLAIRYADSHEGLHSGHFRGEAEYVELREQCMAMLLNTIGDIHSISEAQIDESLMH